MVTPYQKERAPLFLFAGTGREQEIEGGHALNLIDDFLTVPYEAYEIIDPLFLIFKAYFKDLHMLQTCCKIIQYTLIINHIERSLICSICFSLSSIIFSSFSAVLISMRCAFFSN